MFETTVVISRRRKVRLAFVASLPLAIGAHLVVAAAWIATGLWDVRFPLDSPHTVAAYRLLSAVAVPPPPPPPPPPAAPRQSRPSVEIELPDHVAPTIIPDLVPQLEPPEPVGNDEAGVPGGVEGGVAGGQVGGVVGGIVGAVIAESSPPDTVIVPRDAKLPVRPISMVYPMYPEKWRLRRIEGQVILRYTIDETGRVSEVRILVPATFPEFNEVSADAIKRWRFHPLEVNGEKRSIVHELTVNFKIQEPTGRVLRRPKDPPVGTLEPSQR